MEHARVEVLTDVAEACDVLTAAFMTDTAVTEMFGGDEPSLRAVYNFIVPLMLKDSDSIMLGVRDGGGLACVAVCQGPTNDVPVWRMILAGLPIIWRMGRRVRRLVRFGMEMERESPLRPGCLRLAFLGTRPDAFGRGYGSLLLHRLEEHALSRGIRSVYLEAETDHYPHKLYEKRGYRTDKHFECVAGPVDVMVKSLDDEPV